MANVFLVKKCKMEVLADLYDRLAEMEKSATTRYECVGKEEEQATSWRTGELLWEDEEHTIPKYENRYDYVDVDPADLTDNEKARIDAIREVMRTLEKLA